MNIKILEFDIKGDERGSLIAIEGNKNIPFEIKRVFYIFDSEKGVVRGKHANKNSQQILICVRGNCKILVDNGKEKKIILLDKPNKGLYVGSFIWKEMFDFSMDCVLLVLTDKYYDINDYIRDYDKFKELVMKNDKNSSNI